MEHYEEKLVELVVLDLINNAKGWPSSATEWIGLTPPGATITKTDATRHSHCRSLSMCTCCKKQVYLQVYLEPMSFLSLNV